MRLTWDASAKINDQNHVAMATTCGGGAAVRVEVVKGKAGESTTSTTSSSSTTPHELEDLRRISHSTQGFLPSCSLRVEGLPLVGPTHMHSWSMPLSRPGPCLVLVLALPWCPQSCVVVCQSVRLSVSVTKPRMILHAE